MTPRTIGLIAPYFSGVYLGEIISHLHARAIGVGMRLIAVRTGDQTGHYALPLGLDLAEGWLVVADAASDSLIEATCATGLPVCTIGYRSGVARASSVRSDNRSGIREVLQALQALGHRQFAFLGNAGAGDFTERHEAYCEYLIEQGLDGAEDIRFVDCAGYDFFAGHAGVEALVARKCPFTALLCGNDQLALGAVAWLRERGIAVPQEVAVVGYDNSALSGKSGDSLSTVDQNLDGMVEAALGELLARIEEPQRSARELRVPARFVARQSSGHANQPHPDDLRFVTRSQAISTLAVADETNHLVFRSTGEVLSIFLARIRSRLHFGLLAQWTGAERLEALEVTEVVPEALAPHFRAHHHDPRRFPPLDWPGSEFAAAGDFVAVIPADPSFPDRPLAVASFPAAEVSGGFSLDLLVHELERAITISALKRMNQNLESTLNRLRATQLELMRAEKQAALVSMVAGVAHEMNTPIGNCRLSVGAMAAMLEESLTAMHTGPGLRRSQLEDFMSSLQTGFDVLERNLTTAAVLVADFKAIEQAPPRMVRSSVGLAAHLQQLAARQRNRLSGKEVELVLTVESDALLDSYPDAIAQILNELVENAVTHCDGNAQLKISIVSSGGPVLCLVSVQDNGQGIDPQAISRVFDPFYTTRMGRARGLGLALAQRLAADVLGGSLVVAATGSFGTRFELRFPPSAPLGDPFA